MLGISTANAVAIFTSMASLREVKREETRLRVMRLIDQNPAISTRRIAEELGISNGAAYYCLTALIEKGFVKLGNFKANPNKRQYAYLVTAKGIREKSKLTVRFLERKRKEFDDLKAEVAALELEVGDTIDEKSD